MEIKKLFNIKIGLLFIFVLAIGFLFFSQGSTKYFICHDHYTIFCYYENSETENVKNIPCNNDKDCSVNNIHNYCNPGWWNQMKSPNARYYCGKDGFCKGCDCF